MCTNKILTLLFLLFFSMLSLTSCALFMVGDKFGEEIECPYDQKAEKYIINFYRFQNEPKIPPLAIAKDLDVHCEADYPPQSKTEPIVVTILRPDIDKQYESIPANSSSHTPLIHLGGRGKNAYENKKSIYKRQFSRIQKYEEYELENGFSIYKDFSEYRDRNPIPIDLLPKFSPDLSRVLHSL